MIDLTEWESKDSLKKRAPLAAVCAALGIGLDQNGYGLCPFHENDGAKHRPSFNLWISSDGTQRWGCFPCGLNGDVFELVQRVRLCSFGEALRFVAEVVRDAPPWHPVEPPAELDVDALTAYVVAAQSRARRSENAGLLCVAVGLRDETTAHSERLAADARLRELGWGVDDRANIVIPHYKKSCELSGCKIRSLGGDKWSFPRSKFEHLYGIWRPNVSGWKRCLLTEGESDFAHALLSTVPAHVLSLPTGASSFREEWLQDLVGFEEIFLGFDGDPAGDQAVSRWSQSLAIVEDVIEIRRLPVPTDEDLRSCGIPVIELMEKAWKVTA